MAQQKRGLGRGLGALIPTAPPAATWSAAGAAVAAGHSPGGPAASVADGTYYTEIAIGAITPNPRQPRRIFDEDTLAELAFSITEVGLLQPVVVRPVMPGHYELIMGERRWRASRQAGLEHIPAIVRGIGDDDMLRDALMENLHREQLNPLEEAAAYQQLLDDFGATHEELARKVGRSRPHISNTIRLLNLPPAVQHRVAAGVLSAGHARALLALDDPDAQDRLALRIVAEGLSVRTVEEIVAVGGEEAPRPRRAASREPADPALSELAERLSDAFDTRVRVELGRRKGKVVKGKIVVEFASAEDLARIVSAMSVDLAGSGST